MCRGSCGKPSSRTHQGLVEALADAVGLRRAGLGAAVIDILDGQVQLIFVMFARPAVFGAAIGQHYRAGPVVCAFHSGHDDVIQNLPLATSDPSFRKAILPGGAYAGAFRLQTCCFEEA